MSIRIIFLIIFVTCELLMGFEVWAQSEGISIECPSKVSQSEIIKGIVSDPDSTVVILLHPMSTNLWWVQRKPTVINQDGSWQTLCYFGSENQGINEYYEVVAIVTQQHLEEGQTLTKLPDCLLVSKLILVKRVK